MLHASARLERETRDDDGDDDIGISETVLTPNIAGSREQNPRQQAVFVCVYCWGFENIPPQRFHTAVGILFQFYIFFPYPGISLGAKTF